MAEPNYRLPHDDPDDEVFKGSMGLLEHLDELRTRIIRSCLAIGAGMLVAWIFVDRIAMFVLAPTLAALPSGSHLILTRPGEGFSFYLDIALIGGSVLAAPFVMYEVWRFIAPGLYANEKRFAIPFVVLATSGSIGGALFSHYLLFPATISFFAQFNSPQMTLLPRVEDTFELYTRMLVGMVAAFQIPTVVLFLAKMRMVTARFLWRHTMHAILIIFIVAAVLTPSGDPWQQTIFAAPMIGLYLISIAIAWIVAPRREKETPSRTDTHHLRLVFAATVIDHARKHRQHSSWARRTTRR